MIMKLVIGLFTAIVLECVFASGTARSNDARPRLAVSPSYQSFGEGVPSIVIVETPKRVPVLEPGLSHAPLVSAFWQLLNITTPVTTIRSSYSWLCTPTLRRTGAVRFKLNGFKGHYSCRSIPISNSTKHDSELKFFLMTHHPSLFRADIGTISITVTVDNLSSQQLHHSIVGARLLIPSDYDSLQKAVSLGGASIIDIKIRILIREKKLPELHHALNEKTQIEERRSKPRVAQAEKIKQIQQAREREGPLPESLVKKLERVKENIRERWHLLSALVLFILWFCCFADGIILWPIKHSTYSLSLFWSEIILLSGDVETNPGPTPTEDDLRTVDDTLLHDDDLSSIYNAVRPLCAHWYSLGCSLGLPPSLLDEIKQDAVNDTDKCLIKCLHNWLKMNFNHEKNGAPSWRRLVKAISDTGHNQKLAAALLDQHKVKATEGSTEDKRAASLLSRSFEKIKQIQRAREREGPLPESLARKLERVKENIRERWHLVLALALFILWFCCFADGDILWPIKHLTYSLSLFWSEIILLSGDVETNPGPTLTEDDHRTVDDTLLHEDDLTAIFNAVHPLSARWYSLGCSLGLPPSLMDKIQQDVVNDTDKCLIKCLQNWLDENFNHEKNGAPSWRRLVKAISDTGHNQKLAAALLDQHKVKATEGSTEDKSAASLLSRFERSNDFALLAQELSRYFDKNVDISELKEYLKSFCDPYKDPSNDLYVPPRVYNHTASAGKLLECLIPVYISCTNVFLLKYLVNNFGCSESKKLFADYVQKHHLI